MQFEEQLESEELDVLTEVETLENVVAQLDGEESNEEAEEEEEVEEEIEEEEMEEETGDDDVAEEKEG